MENFKYERRKNPLKRNLHSREKHKENIRSRSPLIKIAKKIEKVNKESKKIIKSKIPEKQALIDFKPPTPLRQIIEVPVEQLIERKIFRKQIFKRNLEKEKNIIADSFVKTGLLIMENKRLEMMIKVVKQEIENEKKLLEISEVDINNQGQFKYINNS